MSVIQKLVFRYVIQLSVVLTLVAVSLIIAVLVVAFSLLDHDISSDVSNISKEVLEQSISIREEGIELRDTLKEVIISQNAQFKLIGANGEVLYTLNWPSGEKIQYSKTDIMQLLEEEGPSRQIRSLDINDTQYIAIFEIEQPLEGIIDSIKTIKNDQAIPSYILNDLKTLEANLYVYNQDKIINEHINDQDIDPPTLNQLLDYELKSWNISGNVVTYFNNESQLGYVAVAKNDTYQPENTASITSTILSSIIITFTIIVFILLCLAFWYAFRLGTPLIHVIKWIQALAIHDYQEPKGKSGKPNSIKFNETFKKPYKPFAEIFESLRKLTDTLEENKMQQQEIQETREEWIAGLSHDLKTPLSSIYGYAVMVNTDNYEWEKEELKEFMSIIEKNAIYMSGLIEDINLTYRIKNGSLPIVRENIEMNQFIKHTTQSFMTGHLKRDQSYQIIESNDEIFYEIDTRYFTRILNNLLGNAIKYNPDDTQIIVEVKKTIVGFCILIKDNGIGMDRQTINKLFNRYYRGTTVEDSTEGTGLGLAITKQLVELHNGKIEIESNPDNGATITLVFLTKV